MIETVGIRFKEGGKIYDFDADGKQFNKVYKGMSCFKIIYKRKKDRLLTVFLISGVRYGIRTHGLQGHNLAL